MNTQALKALVELRARPEDVERIEWLGTRANEGQLTGDERQEYQSSVMFANFLGILQPKARRKLQAEG
ncbi:MAG: hypothetical protein ACO1TE_04750 [Prosthecobacter sp.]